MTADSLTIELELKAPPTATFAAIVEPRRWWSAEIEGVTDRLDGEFVFEVPGIHFTRFRVTDLVPVKLVVWHAEEARLTFVADQEEWTNTEVRFELTPHRAGTRLRFVHLGLTPDVECFDACSTAWSSYLHGSLARLVDEGVGDPNQERR